MKKQLIFNKFLLIAVLLICFGLFGSGYILFARKSYADTTPENPGVAKYTIAFKVNGQLLTAYELNPGQEITKPGTITDGFEEIQDYTWVNASDSTTVFNFPNTMPSSHVTLNLKITDASKVPVIFMQENPNFESTTSPNEFKKNKYWGLSIKIATIGTQVTAIPAANVPVKTGHDFKHWKYPENAVAAYDFASSITSSLVLYPHYELTQYTLKFIHYDDQEETISIAWGNRVGGSFPAPKDRAGYSAIGWYDVTDGDQNVFDFSSVSITQAYTFKPVYRDNSCSVTFIDNEFGEITGDPFATAGQSYVCTVTLNSLYNQYALQKENIHWQGGASGASISPTGTLGVYSCTIINVEAPITLNIVNVIKNRYTINFNTNNAVGITVVPDDSLISGTDYVFDGTNYMVEYEKSFSFTLELGENYEAKDIPNYSGGISYFTAGTVTWISSDEYYRVSKTTQNSDIAITLETVECITAMFSGYTDDYGNTVVSMTGFESPDFANNLVSWDELTGRARIRRGSNFMFTAQPSNADRTFIKQVTIGGEICNPDENRYINRYNTNVDVVFDVVPTVYVSVPVTLDGVQSFTLDNGLEYIGSSGTYPNQRDRYRIHNDASIGGGVYSIGFMFKREYTQADVQVIIEPAGTSCTVDKSEWKSNISYGETQTLYIRNITTDITISFGALTLNTYKVNYINVKDVVNFAYTDGSSQNVQHDGEIHLAIYKEAGYSNATITDTNITTTSVGYNEFTLEYKEPVGETPYYLLVFKNVFASFDVTIDNLAINTYRVSLIGNEFATLMSATSTVNHNGSFVCLYELGAAYSRATVNIANVRVVSDNPVTITVNEGLKNITVGEVIGDIEISIQSLVKNTYRVSAEYFANYGHIFTSSVTTAQNTQHGNVFTIKLTFDSSAYTQSIDKIVFQYATNNGDFGELAYTEKVIDPSGIADPYLVYIVPNISGNITFQINSLSKNRYTVIFYDTDPERIVHQYNGVEHGTSITEVTKPTKDGYNCLGWYTTLASSTKFSGYNSITSDLNLYAKYNDIYYTITFKDNGGEFTRQVAHGKPCIMPDIATKAGHAQAYWEKKSGNGTLERVIDNCYVEAIYIIDVYTIRFLNDDVVHDIRTVEYGTTISTPPADPVKQGYTFDKWDYEYRTTPFTQNTDIHATYNINYYDIVYYNITQDYPLCSFSVPYNTIIAEPEADADTRGLYYIDRPPLNEANPDGDHDEYFTLSDGYVLEGWYADEGKSIRFNFENPIKGNTVVYGNMYISKVSIKFFVDGEFYIEKLVEYGTALSDIPSVPRKDGYTQQSPKWEVRKPVGASYTTAVTNNIEVDAVYYLNNYKVVIKVPGRDDFVTTIPHGGTIVNYPTPDTKFGQVVVIDNDLLEYVTSDRVIYITVIDFLPFLIVAAASAVLTFIVVSLVIAIKNISRNIRNVKRMEELFRSIKKQDARLTKIKEQKLKAEIEAQVKEKEKYRRHNFLDN